LNDPHDIIGFYVPAADGGDYGHLVVDYDEKKQDYLVHPVRWCTKDLYRPDKPPQRIDVHKISYRYDLSKKWKSDAKMKYFVYVSAPNVPSMIRGIFQDLNQAREFCQKGNGYRILRKSSWKDGPLPEINDTLPEK